ncbi:MAG TPA: hypothetical protein VKT70_09155 [Stellaceae bacterium]|nr:hypothetical protein [Stellaceae bacterium]
MRRSCFLALCLVLAGFEAHASDTSKAVSGTWKAQDNCTKAAFRKFPDYTAEAEAKRKADIRQCLANSNLPTRDPLVVAPDTTH